MAVRPASLTSIAATAGVSVSTVSKVLNGRSDVAPRTRERVGRLLRQKGYQVAALPGTGVVDLLIGGPDNLWSCRTRLDGYRSALRRVGLTVDEGLVRIGCHGRQRVLD